MKRPKILSLEKIKEYYSKEIHKYRKQAKLKKDNSNLAQDRHYLELLKNYSMLLQKEDDQSIIQDSQRIPVQVEFIKKQKD